jgi:hypothetical protein
MEHVTAGYLRQVWDMNEWLYEGQREFRPAYSCESQIVTVCQDAAYFLDEGARIDAMVIDFSKALVPYDRMLNKNCGLGSGFEGSRIGQGIPLRSFAESQSRKVE